MYFLTQFKFKADGTVDKGTSSYETENDAIVAFHIAISSAMQKEDTQKFTALILDADGKVVKREVYTAHVETEVIVEDVAE